MVGGNNKKISLAAASKFYSVKSNENRVKHQLENAISKDRKHRFLRKMACLFDKSPRVENYKLCQTFSKKVLDNRNEPKKPSKKDYYHKKDYYDTKIRNRFKKLNEFWKPLGRRVCFRKHKSYIILTEIY